MRPTIADANTGSVGARTAAISSASGQGRPDQPHAEQGRDDEGERHPEQQRTTGEAPRAAQIADAEPLAVGEQHHEQGDLRELAHLGVAGFQRDDARHALPEREAGGEEQHGRGEHGAVGDARDEDRRKQHDAETQDHRMLRRSMACGDRNTLCPLRFAAPRLDRVAGCSSLTESTRRTGAWCET